MHKLHLSVDFDKSYLVGVSRGSMQMFLALATHPHLQEFYKKFVSLSGILNIELFAKNNPEWVQKMKDHFEYDGSKAWLDTRNPILQVSKIANKNLPFLLIQGTDDPKVCLEEGYSMLNAMLQSGFTNVSYCEVAGGNHVLKNRTEYFQRIIFWLETRAFR
jgi:dipeptidyl aminopeptidase/acylaminoacyl peptidase